MLYSSGVMPSEKQLSSIQGLRGIAIFMVILFHLLPEVCPHGYMGVDVFFVISGYFLIGKQLQGGRDFRLLPFLIQKGKRLLFPYEALLFLCLVATILLLPAKEMIDSYELFKACLLGIPNIFLAQRSGNYFSVEMRTLPPMHLWYMGVMLQSVLLFSLLFFVWRRCGITQQTRCTHLLLLGVLSAAVAFLYLLPLPYNYASNTYFWTSARLWEFILGGFLYPRDCSAAPARAKRITATALAMLLLCSFLPLPHTALGGIVGSCCGAAVLYFGRGSHASFLPGNKQLVWLGNISFSLYLVHWPCICLTEYSLGHRLSCVEAAVLLVVILSAAYLFHRCIEKPRVSSVFLPVAAILACAAYKGITTTRGFAAYLHSDVNQAMEMAVTEVPLPLLPQKSPLWAGSSGIKSNQFSPVEEPQPLLQELGDTDRPLSFVVMGDSHAGDLSEGLHLIGLTHGWHGVYLNSYIVPFWGAAYLGNRFEAPGNVFDADKAMRVMSWLKCHREISVVFIAQLWSHRLSGHQTWNGQIVEKDILQTRAEELRQFCQQVKNCGKTVVLVTDNPAIPAKSPRRLLSSQLLWHRDFSRLPELCCHREEYEQQNGAINRVMDQLAQDGLCHVLHRENAFFRTDTFTAFDGKHLTHSDQHHLYAAGSVLSLSQNINEIRKLLATDKVVEPAVQPCPREEEIQP